MADNVWNPDQYGGFAGGYDPDEEARKAREAAAAQPQPAFGSAPGFGGNNGFQGFQVPAVNQQANAPIDKGFNLTPGATGAYGAADTNNTGATSVNPNQYIGAGGATIGNAATGNQLNDPVIQNPSQTSPWGAAPVGWSSGDKTVGMQQSPGNIVFGQYGPAAAANSATPINNSGITKVNNGQSGVGFDNNIKAPNYDPNSTNPYLSNNFWMTGFNNMKTITDPYKTARITDPNQAWQKFQFQNPTEDWQKNFNSIADPVARMRYAYNDSLGGNGEYLNTYLSKAGIDPATIQQMRAVFGASPGNNTRGMFEGLGLNADDMMDNQGRLTQIGTQLWNMTQNGKQLVQDFGNKGSFADSSAQNSAATRAMFSNPNSSPWQTMHSQNYGFDSPAGNGMFDTQAHQAASQKVDTNFYASKPTQEEIDYTNRTGKLPDTYNPDGTRKTPQRTVEPVAHTAVNTAQNTAIDRNQRTVSPYRIATRASVN
jgi:hypothetical protein